VAGGDTRRGPATAGSSGLTLGAPEVVTVSGALDLLTSEHTAQPLHRLWFGGPELRARLGEWISAERAYDTSHPTQPPKPALPLSDAHLVHSSLVLSTEPARSEESYKERTGSFREEAIAPPGSVTGAVFRQQAAARPPTAPSRNRPPRCC
jgi:hypothetical protein